MRQFILLCFIICQVSYGQWTFKKGGNKFDGEYKTASILGEGGEWPYTKPVFVINRFGEDEPNLYLASIGYTGCSSPTISFAFDGVDDILVFRSSSDKEKEAAFIEGLAFEIQELLQLLKSKSTVYVRYEDNCSKKDFQFSLKGSTNAINYVIGNYYDKYISQMEERIRREIAESKRIDSIREVIRIEKLIEKRKNDSIQRINDSIQAIKSKKRIDSLSKAFHAPLFDAFDFKGVSTFFRPLKTLFSFKVENTKEVNYCIKKYPSGNSLVDKSQSLYKTERVEVKNRFENSCIRMDVYNGKSENLGYSIFVSLDQLQKISDDYHIKVLESEWSTILKMHNEGL